MKKLIFGFVGDLASGKGTVAKYINEKYNTNTYRFSTMLRDVLNRIYVENSRENLQNLSTFLRENYGQDVMSRVIAKDVLNDPNELVVVEGIRRPTDIIYLKELDGFHLIYITADPKIRFERMLKRNENEGDAEKSFAEFLKDEEAEADKMIKELGKTAEIIINNDGDFENLYTQIENIIKSYK